MIMSRRACFYLMSLLAAMALLVGCKSSKKAVEGETVQEKSRKALFQSLEANAFRYETMTARLNMTLRLPGKELSSRVDLRLARDSALQLSVQPFLGVELFQLLGHHGPVLLIGHAVVVDIDVSVGIETARELVLVDIRRLPRIVDCGDNLVRVAAGIHRDDIVAADKRADDDGHQKNENQSDCDFSFHIFSDKGCFINSMTIIHIRARPRKRFSHKESV